MADWINVDVEIAIKKEIETLTQVINVVAHTPTDQACRILRYASDFLARPPQPQMGKVNAEDVINAMLKASSFKQPEAGSDNKD